MRKLKYHNIFKFINTVHFISVKKLKKEENIQTLLFYFLILIKMKMPSL